MVKHPTKRLLQNVVVVIGVALIVFGVASVFMPAAIILAGLFLIGLAIEVDK